MTTQQVAKKLVELCKQGKFEEAMEATYAPNIVSIEPHPGGGEMPQKMEGIAAVRKKSQWWNENHEIHGVKVDGPWPAEDRFIVRFVIDVTAKTGPMKGKRMTMDETGLYTVKDGKVVREEFFYDMGG